MRNEDLKKLIKNEKVEEAIIKVIEYEQSKLHKDRPHYKAEYKRIIEEVVDENK